MKHSTIARRMFALMFALVLLSGGTAAAQNYTSTQDTSSQDTSTQDTSTQDTSASPALSPGDVITINRSGFQPASTVQVILTYDDSTELVLTTLIADDDGTIVGNVTIPDDFDNNGSLTTSGVSSDGAEQVLGAEIVNGAVGEPSSSGSSSTKWLLGAGAATLAAGALYFFLQRVRSKPGVCPF